MNAITTVSGRDFKAANYLGTSLAVITKEYRPSIPFTVDGVKKNAPAYKVDVVVLTGDNAGLWYEDVLLFQKALITQCEKADESDTVIGTLTRVPVEDTDNSYYLLQDPTTAEIRLAAAFGV